jgi:integrase
MERLTALLRSRAMQHLDVNPASAAAIGRSDGDVSRLTVSDLIDRYLDHCANRVRTGELKASTLALFYRPYLRLLKAALGSRKLTTLTDAVIADYRAVLVHRGLRPDTVGNHLRALRACVRWGQQPGAFPGIPVGKIRCPAPRRRETIPTLQEIQRLLVAARADVRDVLETIASIAVRPGDCYGLRWRHVDFDAGLLRLDDSKVGPRLVCLVPRIVEVLKARWRVTANPNDFVFTTVSGRPWTIRYFGQLVRQARQRAGLGRHCVAYGLRHFWTTSALLAGIDVATVRALRQDRHFGTVLRYEHLVDHVGYLKDAAAQAARAMSRADH